MIFCQRNPFQNIQLNEIALSSDSLLQYIRNYLQEHDDEYRFDEGVSEIKFEYGVLLMFRKNGYMNESLKDTVPGYHPSYSPSHSPSSLPPVNEEYILINTIIITPFILTNTVLTIYSIFVRRRRNNPNNKG